MGPGQAQGRATSRMQPGQAGRLLGRVQPSPPKGLSGPCCSQPRGALAPAPFRALTAACDTVLPPPPLTGHRPREAQTLTSAFRPRTQHGAVSCVLPANTVWWPDTCRQDVPGNWRCGRTHRWLPGPTLKTCAARTADSLTPRGSETGKAEALPGTDAVRGSGGQAPVPGVPLDGCKTSQSVSQRPRSLSIFVNPDGKSCWRCDGYDSSFCGPGAQRDSAHTGDGEQPAPVTYTHGPRTAGMAPWGSGKEWRGGQSHSGFRTRVGSRD